MAPRMFFVGQLCVFFSFPFTRALGRLQSIDPAIDLLIRTTRYHIKGFVRFCFAASHDSSG